MPDPRLALCVGDPAGIGPEIVLRALAHEKCPPAEWVVYGPLGVLAERAKRFELRGVADRDLDPRGHPAVPGDRGAGLIHRPAGATPGCSVPARTFAPAKSNQYSFRGCFELFTNSTGTAICDAPDFKSPPQSCQAGPAGAHVA